MEVEPNRGAVVRAFDRADLLDLYEVRALLEPAAAARAARRMTPHDIARLEAAATRPSGPATTRTPRSRSTRSSTGSSARPPAARASGWPCAPWPASRAAFRSVFWHSEEQRAESLLCHRRLVTAFRTGDAALAEAVMRMHILGAVAFLEEVTTHG